MIKTVLIKSSKHIVGSIILITLINTSILKDKYQLITLFVLFGIVLLFKAWINYLKDDHFKPTLTSNIFKKDFNDSLNTIEKEDSTYSKISLIVSGLFLIIISFLL